MSKCILVFVNLMQKKGGKVWVIQRNIEEEERQAQKKEELEKEIKENNQKILI